jgi:hypothetical protein
MLIYDKKTGTVLDARYCVFIDDFAGERFEEPPTPEDWIYIADEDCVPVVSGYNAFRFLTERMTDLILSATRDTDGNDLDPYDM